MSQPEIPAGQPSGPWRSRFRPSPVVLAAVALLLAGTALRVVFALKGVESPMIDENEVAEQAVAFMGGELKAHFLKYGPLTMYVLAGIYRLAALLHGQSSLEYASRVFFDGAEHYAIARLYTVGWLSVLALLAFLSFRRRLGAAPALLACALLAFPFIEVLGQGARIDYPQGAFQCIALLALGEVVARPRLRYWLAAGVFAGLGIATKPLPGLLLGPCFLVASWAAAATRADGRRRPPLARLGAALTSPGMWLAGVAVAACAAVGDPAMLDIGSFIQSQREAVALHSSGKLQARASIADSFAMLRVPFLIALAAAVVLVLIARDIGALNIALFIAVYLAAFAGRQARTYFFIAPAAASCLLVGHAWAALSALVLPRLREPRWLSWALAPVAILLLQSPLRYLFGQRLAPNNATEARAWVYEHIPSGTPIFHLGLRPSGPRLVATDEKLQARWGDHFDYGRNNYRFLKEAFRHAFRAYQKSGLPRYPLAVHDDKPYPRADNRLPRWLTDNLVARARQDGQRYIIVAGYRGDVHELGYRWLDQAQLETQIGNIAIFRVPDAPPATAPVSNSN
ncbi:MAG TPA: glycosyltransferase family 39 protein [Polyangiaceae bacterium]|jgi:hypothetical protein|nr:glycosyltransferase family 39 protein [Polyangiaceae bacterium]